MKKDSRFILSVMTTILCLCSCAGSSSSSSSKTNAALAEVTPMSLTEEETAYVDSLKSSGKSLKVAHLPNRYPISYSENDVPTGIIPDMLNYLEVYTGLPMEFTFLQVGQKTVDALDSGYCDLVAGLMRYQFLLDPLPDNLKDKTCVSAILSASFVMVAKKGREIDLSSQLKIVTLKSFAGLIRKVTSEYPNWEIMATKSSNEECIKAILAGEADIMIQNGYVVNWFMSMPRYFDLEVIQAYHWVEEDTIAGLSSLDPAVYSILDRAINSWDTSYVDQLVINRTVGQQYQPTLEDYMYQYKTPIIIVGVLFVLLVLALVVIILMRHKNERRLKDKNAQLAEAVEQAQDASMAKSDFLARMSHEIRTPMNAIVGYTDLARESLSDPKTLNYLDKIQSSSKTLLGMLNDILDMSSIENHKLKIADAPFSLKNLLNGILAMYYPFCKSKGVEVEAFAALEDETYIGDQVRINQILLNLVSNAYKFTPQGGTITLSAKENKHNDDTVFVEFMVKDNGIGISKEKLAHIFEAFDQEDASTARKYGGSGLGLSITKNLVDLLHGSIEVESEKGKGTIFTVELPLKKGESAVSGSQHESKDAKILLVYDDPDVLQYVSTILKTIGARFLSAKNGKEAIPLIATSLKDKDPFDFCLIDWKMSGTNGRESLRAIRQVYSQKQIPIVISAYDINEAMEEANKSGADRIIPKPIFQSNILGVIADFSKSSETKPQLYKKPSYDFHGKRVLMAEDNEFNRELADEILKMANLVTIDAKNGQEAYDIYLKEKENIDLVILDIQMPLMDGYMVAKKIRSLPDPISQKIPIIAMTANSSDKDVAKALSSGMNDQISKPIDTKALFACITKLLSSSKQ